MYDVHEDTTALKGRFGVLATVFTALFVILLGRLFYVQIVRGDEYREAAKTSFTVTERLPARRGEIKDRTGTVLAKNVPVGRVGEAEEFANVAAFLCSERASYVSGVALPVDGGSSAGLA